MTACFLKGNEKVEFFEKHFSFMPGCFFSWGTPNVIKYDWVLSDYCTYSNQQLTPETISTYRQYWWPFALTAVHKDYQKEAERSCILECQKLDMSCNDCFFMKRIDQKNGDCTKLNKAVKLWPNFPMYSLNKECFKHRKEI